MKVLQINSVCGIGSTGRIATDLHQTLINSGHESYIAFGRNTPRNCAENIRIGTDLDVCRHVLLTRTLDKHGFGSRKATRLFLRSVEDLDPDIIHLHNIHGYYINIELLFEYLKSVDKPVVWTLHDCWPFTGHCSHFDYIGCDKWKTHCGNCPQRGEYPKSLIDNSRLNFARKKESFTGIRDLTIVSPSKWLAELVKTSFLGNYPVNVINNGIDLSVFKPTSSDFRRKYGLEDKFIILGVANVWSAKKGLHIFYELSGQLLEDEVVILVGLSPTQMKDLPEGIVGITNTKNAVELASIYSAADVFLNPTLEDNFPTTNIEALACGLPVITFDTGGSPESVLGDCGMVVEKNNLNGLVNAIQKMKDVDKSSVQADCTQVAIRHFNKWKTNRSYLKLYNKE